MSENTCSICSGQLRYVFSALVLSKYDAEYFHCDACGFLCVPDPHWLSESYSSAIADADTGLVSRNIGIAKKLSLLLFWGMAARRESRYLDAAGGYGMLTRLMRDYGFDFYWSDKYCKNVLARGFEYNAEVGPCVAVTAMEVLEHLADPVEYIRESLACASAETFIFTTELYDGAPPAPNEWWYYSLPTGQHIGFFQLRTLHRIAEVLGLNLYSANGLHVLTKRKLNLAWVRVVTGSGFSRIGDHLLRRLMKSKTMDDHRKVLGSVS